jgi:ribosomal protein L37AE/L43A
MVKDAPSCPWCCSAKHVHSSGTTLRAWHCRNCGREFEAGDDGDITYGNPDKRLLREERRRERRRPRL